MIYTTFYRSHFLHDLWTTYKLYSVLNLCNFIYMGILYFSINLNRYLFHRSRQDGHSTIIQCLYDSTSSFQDPPQSDICFFLIFVLYIQVTNQLSLETLYSITHLSDYPRSFWETLGNDYFHDNQRKRVPQKARKKKIL